MVDVLEITSIETVPIKARLDRVYQGSFYSMPYRATIITRVHTADGIIGEAYNADSDEEQAEIVAIIGNELAPAVKGMNALQVERCWEVMQPSNFDQLRDRRLTQQAIACVDTAIWDAVGKAVGQPLHRLWGGYRETIPMIVIGGYYEVPGKPPIEEEVKGYSDAGFAGMKFKVGGKTPEEDAERLHRAVTTVRDGFKFVVDANQGYTLRDAIRFTQLVSEFVTIEWFEEPCRWRNDRLDMRDFRAITGVPVAAGQSEISAGPMRDMMVSGAIDVSNFDASWGGGPTEWRRVAAMAHTYSVKLGHHEEPHVASHLLASQPHGTFVEVFSQSRDPVFWNMITNRPELEEGKFPLSNAPGLGWQLDEDFIDKHRVRDTD